MRELKNISLIWMTKWVAKISRLFNIGGGSTWPGHLVLKFSPDLFPFLSQQIKKGVIIVAGTNGKTTTAKMIRTILESSGCQVVHNAAGANLLNGIVSSLLDRVNWWGKLDVDYGIFEIDENTFPAAIVNLKPQIVIILNLFRDQLDRYGEIDSIAGKWQRALEALPRNTTVILNADDPQVSILGEDLKTQVLYFGLQDPKIFLKEREYAMDVIYCPKCGAKLNFLGLYFSHLGHWQCMKCKISRPKLNLSNWDWLLPGVHNRYNTLAAVLSGEVLGFTNEQIKMALSKFKPAFGRQEEFSIKGKKVKIFLSKNPTGLNETIRTLNEDKRKKVIAVFLNDKIPDGRDVSWIWDVDFEPLIASARHLIVGGLRAYDMGIRLKYTDYAKRDFLVEEDYERAIRRGLKETKNEETFYILPTYSAMLEVRKILGGRKIL